MENSATHSSESGAELQEKSETTPTRIADSRGNLSTNESSEMNIEQIPVETAVSGFESRSDSEKDSDLLHSAIEEGNYTEVINLLECGADVNAVASSRRFKKPSPPPTDVIRKRYDLANILGSYEADAFDRYREPPLLLSFTNYRMRRFPPNNGIHVIDCPDSRHSAVSKKSTDMAEVNEEGFTPLHRSAGNGNLKISTLLISKGATVDAKAKDGKTPLHLAVANGYEEVVELLLKNSAQADCNDSLWQTPLKMAAEKGHSGIIETLFKHGARVNSQPWSGQTPLHLAACNGHVLVVKSLLEKGAKVNSKNVSSQTALHLTCKMGHSLVVKVLLAYGACVNATTWFNDSPLHVAIEAGREEIVKLLLEKGAKMDCKGNNGLIPLHLAVQRGHSGIVDALLPFSTCINSKDDIGKIALHMASNCSRPNAKIVDTLIEYGADVNSNDELPSRPLDFEFGMVRNWFRNPFEQNDRHRVKMEAAGLGYLELSPPINRRELGLEKFYSECQLEITKMKSEFIGNSDLSYYDILRKNTSFVAKHMKNPSVVLALESESFSVNYPIYAGIIRSRLRKGWAREKLLGPATQVFCCLCDLPDLCVEKVLDFLDNDDLRVLLDLDV